MNIKFRVKKDLEITINDYCTFDKLLKKDDIVYEEYIENMWEHGEPKATGRFDFGEYFQEVSPLEEIMKDIFDAEEITIYEGGDHNKYNKGQYFIGGPCGDGDEGNESITKEQYKLLKELKNE